MVLEISVFFPLPRTSRIIPLAGGLGQSGITPGPRAHPCHRSLPPRSHPCPCEERQMRAKPSFSAHPPTAQPDLPLPSAPPQERRNGEGRRGTGQDPGSAACQIPRAGKFWQASLALSPAAARWRCCSHTTSGPPPSSQGTPVSAPQGLFLTLFALWMQNSGEPGCFSTAQCVTTSHH